MSKRPNDSNKSTAKAVAKVTKTALPKGEDLLGSLELKQRLQDARDQTLRNEINGGDKK